MAWLSKVEQIRGYEEFIAQLRGDIEDLRRGQLKIERSGNDGKIKPMDVDQEINSIERLVLLLEGALERAHFTAPE